MVFRALEGRGDINLRIYVDMYGCWYEQVDDMAVLKRWRWVPVSWRDWGGISISIIVIITIIIIIIIIIIVGLKAPT